MILMQSVTSQSKNKNTSKQIAEMIHYSSMTGGHPALLTQDTNNKTLNISAMAGRSRYLQENHRPLHRQT